MKRSTLSTTRQYPLVVGRHHDWNGPDAERALRNDLREAAVAWYTEQDGASAELAVRAAQLLVTGQLGDRLGVNVIALDREHLAHYLRAATIEATPADQQHRWRANEDADIAPNTLRDRCLTCNVLRYDALEHSLSVGPQRRQRAAYSNARAAGPCPGPRTEATS